MYLILHDIIIMVAIHRSEFQVSFFKKKKKVQSIEILIDTHVVKSTTPNISVALYHFYGRSSHCLSIFHFQSMTSRRNVNVQGDLAIWLPLTLDVSCWKSSLLTLKSYILQSYPCGGLSSQVCKAAFTGLSPSKFY